MSNQDEEVTLGTGRLLGLFFGLVIVCSLFFSLGFSLGRRSLAEPLPAASTTTPATVGGEAKPSPARAEAESKPDCANGGVCPDNAAKSTTDELTFYKAVEQNQPKAKLEPPAPPPAPRAKSPELRRSSLLGAGYMVQVAAVRKQDDAEALVQALRKKNYPVITTSGPNDRLYHVQVGPFADLKVAEATRSRLIANGYSPILKK